MLVVRKHPLIFDSLKKMLCNSFDMMDLGEAQYILEMKLSQERRRKEESYGYHKSNTLRGYYRSSA